MALGWFDETALALGWFDETALALGWFDDTLLADGTAPAGITGTLAATQAGNTVTASGQLAIAGALAATQASNTLSAVGSLPIAGVLSAAQAGNTVAGAGQLAISGTVSAAQGGDTLSAAGTLSAVGISGQLSVSQAGDAAISAGQLAVAGAASVAQAGDALSAAGQVALVATLSASQTGNTISAAGAGPTTSDPRLDQIIAILMGRKVYDSTTRLWRVYDQHGTELADPSGILMRGLHGWLLRQNAVLSVKPEAAGGGYKRRVVVTYRDRQYSIWDDELKPFLERIKQEELKAKGTKKRARQKAPPEVVIKSAPIDIKEHLQAEVDAANDYLVEVWNRRFGTQFSRSNGGTRIALIDQNGIDFNGGTVFPFNSVVEADMVFVLAMLAEAA